MLGAGVFHAHAFDGGGVHCVAGCRQVGRGLAFTGLEGCAVGIARGALSVDEVREIEEKEECGREEK